VQQGQSEDLLGLSSPAPATSSVLPADPFSQTTGAQPTIAPLQVPSNDVLGLFDSLSVSTGNKTPQPSSTFHDPFAVAPQPSPIPFASPLPVTPASNVTPVGASSGQVPPGVAGQPGAYYMNVQTHPGMLHQPQPPPPLAQASGGSGAQQVHQFHQQHPLPMQQQAGPRPPQQQPAAAGAFSATPHALITPTAMGAGQNQYPFASPPAQQSPMPFGLPGSQQPPGTQQPPPSRSQFDPFA
jgi:hypothetical protein